MNLFRVLLAAMLLALTGLFNVGLVEVRVDEINYHISRIAEAEAASKTFGIVAKYELIKRRMLGREDDMENYELEARVAALTSAEETKDEDRKKFKDHLLGPVRGLINLVRVMTGKPAINPVRENRVIKALEIGYFWERTRRYQEAIKIYDDVLGMPGVTDEIKAAVMAHKAFCQSMLSDYQAAKEIYERIISTYPETQAGVLSWKLLDFIQSMEKEREVLKEAAGSDLERAKQYYMLMDYRSAIKYFSLFLQSSPPPEAEFEARYYKGRSHEELGEIEEATAEYNQVIRNDKSRQWARQANRRMIMVGEFYEQKKQMADEARKQLAAYQDEGFVSRIDQFAGMVSESSLRKELMGEAGGKKPRPAALADDSLMKLMDQIGKLDLTGEDARKKQEELDRVKEELMAKGKISPQELLEYQRIQTLKENPYRRPLAIKKAIDGNAEQLKYLYNKRLRGGAKIRGRMLVEIRIKSDGTVGKARIARSDLGDQTFEDQVVAQISSWRFDSVPDSLGELVVNFPFEFHEEE